jgi:hypothetical protein
MIYMLGELIPHGLANFVIALAVKPVRGGEAFKIGDGFDVPNNDARAHEGYSTR